MSCRDRVVADLVEPISSNFDCDDLGQISSFVSQRLSLRSVVLDLCRDPLWSEGEKDEQEEARSTLEVNDWADEATVDVAGVGHGRGCGDQGDEKEDDS
ncbi:hypothetical protein L484_008584 [Morus notabilis]|uniref:Uncharacterized protein n=1 Tax=Morus notabilis TaxID=981085 RepID=W9QRS7_9ROSA|nr:hypothetical protein L484_008584 [Morus notabilis]